MNKILKPDNDKLYNTMSVLKCPYESQMSGYYHELYLGFFLILGGKSPLSRARQKLSHLTPEALFNYSYKKKKTR